MLYGYLSADICSYLFRDENSFPKAKLEESVSLGERIMSKDNIFTSNGANVFHILQIFFATREENVNEHLTVCWVKCLLFSLICKIL